MNEFEIKLNTLQKVRNFSEKVATMEEDIDIIVGRYVVDAKSVLGILSIDLNRVLRLRIHTTDVERCKEFQKEMKEFFI